MKTKKFAYWTVMLVMILAMSACNAAPAAVQGTPDLAATVAMSVALAQTVAAAQTQTEMVLNPVTPTSEATLTPQITSTPTVGFTPTPQGVYLTVSKDTNCRTGANSAFSIAVTIKPGDRVEVVGVNPEKDTYYVINPEKSYAYCWVWGKYATVEGETDLLPVLTPQPTPTPTRTPTPATAFDFSLVKTETCSGNYYFKFMIKNVGGATMQYIYIGMTDTSNSTSFTHASNTFTEYSGCDLVSEQGDLTQGEYAYVSTYNPGVIGYDPAGHSFDMTIKLCTGENMGGTCVSRDFTIIP